jgi:penicillin-binding protein 2
MSLSPPKRRTVRIGARMPPLFEAMSAIEAGFFRSAGFYLRVSILGGAAILLFGLLAIRVWSLQILQHDRYAQLAQDQSFRFVDLPAPRGAVLDSKGRLLVGTAGRLVVAADADALGRVRADGQWHAGGNGRVVLARLALLSKTPLRKIEQSIEASLVRSPFTPAVALPRVTQPLALYLDERPEAFPGLHVASLPARSYPQGSLGSEFLGLLGEVSPRQLKAHTFTAARAGETVGQSGVERTYDSILNGGFEQARARVDAAGHTVGRLLPLRMTDSAHGLQLSIDTRLQRRAIQAIRDGIRLAHLNGHADADAGAAVVMNPQTGAIYALASYPGFNQVAAAKNPSYLAHLLDSGGSLVNRAIAGIYPTGSTFKPIVAEAALASGMITPSSILQCTGSLRVGGIVFHNVEPAIDASLDLRQALAMSCDTWFYQLGERFYFDQRATGKTRLQSWARWLGLGHPTGVDVPGEVGGVVPTPAWLRRTQKGWDKIWYEGTSVNLSIGQGYLAVTPLQLAVAYSALANGGTIVRPHVAQAEVDDSGHVLRRLSFPPRTRLRLVDVDTIREGLYDAAHSSIGTSTSVFGDFPVPVAGKTGTAEIGVSCTRERAEQQLCDLADTSDTDAWFVGYGPARPGCGASAAVGVVLMGGGAGGDTAAPAARDVLRAALGGRRC